jgi:hypoxanthine phosphoribosyltransferase
VEHWGIVATPTEKAVIKFPLYVDIKDKCVLLVDDITDTGDTLRVSLEHLKKFKPKEIRTAVLTGLIKNVKAAGIHSEEDIRRELKSKYNIEVQVEMIKEILSEIG